MSALVLGCAVVNSQDTLFYGFEESLDGFVHYADGGLTGSTQISAESWDGKGSLGIEVTNNASGTIQMVSKKVNVLPGQVLHYSFYIKSNQERIVIIKSQYDLQDGGVAVFWEKSDIQLTESWKKVELSVQVPDKISGKIPERLFVGFIDMNVSGLSGLKYFVDNYSIFIPKEIEDNGIPESIYVTMKGNDMQDGSVHAPLRTLKAASKLAGPGDTVWIDEGVYPETLYPGTGSIDAPLVYRALPGKHVIITGCDTSQNWMLAEGNVYASDISEQILQVFHNGKLMNIARWPDLKQDDLFQPQYSFIDRLIKADLNDTVKLYANALNGLPDFEGGRIWMQGKGKWGALSEPILSKKGDTIHFINHYSSDIHSDACPDDGSWFFLYGKRDLLNYEKEWYQDLSNGLLHFYPPGGANPSDGTTLVRTRYNGLILNGNHVKIQNIVFFAAGAEINGSYNSIEQCNFYYPCPFFNVSLWNSNTGVLLKGNNNTISSCEIAYSWGTGITIPGWGIPSDPHSGNRIEECLIHDVNWMGAYDGAINVYGSEHYVGKNTIYKMGRSGIHGVNKSCLIEKNHIHGIGYLSWDLGAIYFSNGSDPAGDKEGLIIRMNYAHQRSTEPDPVHYYSGIYLDVAVSNANVHNNVVQGLLNGVQMNGPVKDNMVFNNAMIIKGNAMFHYDQGDPANKYTNVLSYNNISNKSSFLGTDRKSNFHQNNFINFALAGPEYGDFRPAKSSPVIDAGTPIEGFTDYAIGKVDAGAYEFLAEGDAGNWLPGISWTPAWNSLPAAEIMIKKDSLQPNRYFFSATNATDNDGWIMRYQWDFGDNTFDYGKEVSHSFDKNGKYTISLNLRDDLAGQTIITTILDSVRIENPAGMKRNVSASFFEAFPNPFSNYSSFRITGHVQLLRITDLNGRLLKEFHNLTTGVYSLDAESLPPGIMIATAVGAKENQSILLIKKRP